MAIDQAYVQSASTSDNHARKYERINISPLASSMGAEVIGIDLAALDDQTFAELADALYHHKMLYCREQSLSFDDQEKLTERFGEYGDDAYTSGVPGHPNIQRVVKEAHERAPLIFGGSWHTDSPFLERPPSVSLLYGVDIPPYGGDTIWTNTVQAYAALGDTLKSMLQPLRVHMSGRRVVRALRQNAGPDDGVQITSMDVDLREQQLVDGAYHPLVRTHPVTGEKSLYVDETYTVGIEGMSDYEAAPLLTFLCTHVTRPIFQCRLRWEPHTFAMWDNRSCLHHAFNDHDGYRREMLRTIVAGEIPV